MKKYLLALAVALLPFAAKGWYEDGTEALQEGVLSWGSANLPARSLQPMGSYITEGTDQAINSGAGWTEAAGTFYNHHIVFNVTTETDGGTLAVQGDKINEATGATISGHTEYLVIDGTGYYQTDTKFIGGVAATTSDADIICDIYGASYYDAQNKMFRVRGVRFSWVPSSTTWDISLDVNKVNEDGSITELTSIFDFANGDSTPRAGNGVQGHAKISLSELVDGAGNEGIYIIVNGAGGTPTNIREMNLSITLD